VTVLTVTVFYVTVFHVITNPFRYGGIVRDEDFCPRTRLEQRLASLFRSGQNVALIGPRRVGKSSLIHRAALAVRGATLVYADLWGINTSADLVRRCVQALDAIEDKTTLLTRIAQSLPGLSVTIGADPVTGLPTLTPTLEARRQAAPESVAQIARLWGSLHATSGKLIVALDEFQDLGSVEDADQVLGVLRREVQVLGRLPFCFCGSVRNEMWRVFGGDGGVFYKSAAMLEVAADDFDDWRGFLRNRFDLGRLRIADDELDMIMDLAGGNPGDTQQLCAAVWDVARGRSSRKVTAPLVTEGLLQVFADERKGYEQQVADVSGQQLAVLRTVAQLGGGSVQSAEFLTRAGITHASSSKAAATRLINRRILEETPDGLRFSNPFFRAWLLHSGY
jgi:hypothetical protein